MVPWQTSSEFYRRLSCKSTSFFMPLPMSFFKHFRSPWHYLSFPFSSRPPCVSPPLLDDKTFAQTVYSCCRCAHPSISLFLPLVPFRAEYESVVCLQISWDRPSVKTKLAQSGALQRSTPRTWTMRRRWWRRRRKPSHHTSLDGL